MSIKSLRANLLEFVKDLGGVFVAPNASLDKQIVVRFDNGYGASIIPDDRNNPDNGLYELAVIKFRGKKFRGKNKGWSLDYDTGITDSVIRNLNSGEIAYTLEKIKTLPFANKKGTK